jgi:hypothetical protein
MKTFKEYLRDLAQKESTAAKRNKISSLLGLMPPIAEPNINAGATADPRFVDYYNKYVKGKIKKQPQVAEAINRGIDKWLDAVDKLKKDLDNVGDEEGEPDEKVPTDLEPEEGEPEDLGDEEGEPGEDGIEDSEDDDEPQPIHKPKFHKPIPDDEEIGRAHV